MAGKPYRTDILIIVPAGIVVACNADAKGGWDKLGGEFTFTVPLTNNPPGAVTRYMANTRCTVDHLQSMKTSVLQRASVKAWVSDTQGDNAALTTLFGGMSNVTVGAYDVDAVLDAEGLQRVVTEV